MERKQEISVIIYSQFELFFHDFTGLRKIHCLVNDWNEEIFLNRALWTIYLQLTMKLKLSESFPWMQETYRMEEMCFKSWVLTHHLKFIFSDFSISHAKENKGGSPCPITGLPARPPGPLAFPYHHVAPPESWGFRWIQSKSSWCLFFIDKSRN